MFLFVKGIVIGLVIAVPVGPIGLLCIHRTLAGGTVSGLASGLGVAAADALAAGIAVLGLTLISAFLVSQEAWLHLAGGLFLCYLGVRTFLARPAKEARAPKANGLLGDFVSTFFLTFTNPVTISSFVAILAAFGLGGASESYLATAVLIAGIFIGSALWWIILGVPLHLNGTKFNTEGLQWLSRISGVLITGFGFIVLLAG